MLPSLRSGEFDESDIADRGGDLGNSTSNEPFVIVVNMPGKDRLDLRFVMNVFQRLAGDPVGKLLLIAFGRIRSHQMLRNSCQKGNGSVLGTDGVELLLVERRVHHKYYGKFLFCFALQERQLIGIEQIVAVVQSDKIDAADDA